jgi:nitroreductase
MHEISVETLKELIDLARLSPSGKNMQALRYVLSVGKERNDKIFPCLTWAAYLRDWNGPEPHERPTAYIVVTMDTQLTDYIFCDDGIAMQSILLGAVEKGLGGCIIGAVHKEKLREVLCLPEHYRILYVMALGKPVETVVIEEMQNNDIRYWRDEDRVHHVPKRRLEDLIIQPE